MGEWVGKTEPGSVREKADAAGVCVCVCVCAVDLFLEQF